MKKATALLLSGMMALSMVGCGASDTATTEEPTTDTAAEAEDTTSAPEGGVTIQVTTTYAGEDTNAQNYKDAVAAWEAETGNKVEDSSATSDETFKSRIVTDFEAGSEPDVLFYFNGVDSNQFVEQGKVVSVDEIRETYPDYASNMKDDLLGASPADGVNYSVPVNGYWEGMFVNKEVCEAAGVEVPTADTTWEEFMDICATIKDAGYTPIACSLQEVPHYWFEYAIYNHQDAKTHNTLPTSADDEIGQAWAAGLNDIKGLYEDGFLPENTLTATDAETFQLFTEDKAAFLIDGSWKVGGIESAVDDIENFTVTHVPGMGNRKSTDEIGGLSMGYFITRKGYDDADKQAACVSFVEYMTSDEVVSKFAGTSVTALKNGAKPDTSSFTALGNAALEYAGSFTGISPAVQDNLNEAARAPIFGDMASIVKGSVDAADAVAEVLSIANE
ncbi:MAG: extracellular solute-binding protein [Pseudobutyrivibrio sp.]|nr:extracellular solute-binding protein [Pseudobutyrivibrio sp.]